MDSSKVNSKKKKLSSQSSFFLFVVVVVVLLGLFGVYYTWNEKAPGDAIHIKEYEALLIRAKELTDKYKNLASGTTVSSVASPTVSEGGGLGNLRSSYLHSGNVVEKADLVLGMAQDTDPKNLAVFCRSLRSVSTADVIIFTNEPIPARHHEIAKQSRVTLIGFDLSRVQPSSMQNYHPSTLRWPLFYSHFSEHPSLLERYGRVWMIDVRDSFFQSDPFSFVTPQQQQQQQQAHTATTAANSAVGGRNNRGVGPGGSVDSSSPPGGGEIGFHVFTGVESFPIKECGWNSGWIKDCFGAGVLNSVGSKGIICSGVSAGTMSAALEYMRTMNDIIVGKDHSQGAKFPHCERNGVDQGVHNVLVHTGALEHLHVKQWSQADGPVANMQARMASIDCAPVKGGEEHCIVHNKAGAVVNVVHQYDRFPDLQKYLFHKYVDWVKTGDLAAEWADEPACKAYSYQADTDLFKAVCDLKKKGGVTAAAACCTACDAAQGCQAFTFFAGSCFLKNCGAGGGSGRAGATKALQGAVSGYKK